MNTKDSLLSMIRNGRSMSLRQQLRLTVVLSIPAIIAQLSAIIMQYIDAAMVGSLGTDSSASIGLMATSTWLFWGLCTAAATGFSVQVAHRIGASDPDGARKVLRQAILITGLFSILLVFIGLSISSRLPVWLGGSNEITGNATAYFRVFVCSLPVLQLSFLAGAMLRCSGNTLFPGLVNVVMCLLDVVFNFFLIFDGHDINIFGHHIYLPGAGMGVVGAAFGTALATFIGGITMLVYLWFRNRELNLKGTHGHFRPTKDCINKALRIGSPLGAEHLLLCGAQVLTTVIVAPLGAAAIAANAFAVTAESLCYMPGYGIAEAATTLVGQSLGASRKLLAKKFAKITVASGIVIMTLMGVILWFGAPYIMGIITPVDDIRLMGVEALRIEAWAEPMFAASIVAYGVFVGAGDTLIPCCMNLGSIWGVRLTLAALLAPTLGLNGVWLAMAIELCFRGSIFLWRLKTDKWMKLTTNNKHELQF